MNDKPKVVTVYLDGKKIAKALMPIIIKTIKDNKPKDKS